MNVRRPTSRRFVEALEDRVLLSGDYAFAYQLGSAPTHTLSNNDLGNAVAVDRQGNSYIAGGFAGSVDFNPSSRKSFVMTSLGATDVFVAKFAPDGTFLWARQAGGSGEDQATCLTVDKHGSVFLGGAFSAEADFKPGKRQAVLASEGGTDAFVWELDYTGSLVNAIRAGGPGNDAVNAIALDPNNFIVISGFFNTIADFASTDLATNGAQDAFVARISTKFSLAWAENVGGIDNDDGAALGIDAAGNVFLAGYFSGTADFDPGDGTVDVVSNGAQDAYVLKLAPTGAFSYVKQFGGTGIDAADAMAVDRAGNVIVGGSFNNTVDFDPGAGTHNLTSAGGDDAFVAKLTNAGALVWAGRAGGANPEAIRSLTVDRPGNVYVTGQFNGTADFDPGAGVSNLVGTSGVANGFVWKLDAGGGFTYARGLTTATGFCEGTGIALDDFGNVYLSGRFSGTVDFNPGRKNNSRSTGVDTSYDAFLEKLLA